MSQQQRDVPDQRIVALPRHSATASSGWGRTMTDRTTTRAAASRETADTLVEPFSVPGPPPGEVPYYRDYDGFLAVLDRVRAGEGGEVLGHVVAELWWFEGGEGVELWSDFAGDPPVLPEEILGGRRDFGFPDVYREDRAR